jgi:hypothetical protein
VLWCGNHLSGLLDFYFAGEDVLLFDLAVTANDWCADAAMLAELIAGYETIRPLTGRAGSLVAGAPGRGVALLAAASGSPAPPGRGSVPW